MLGDRQIPSGGTESFKNMIRAALVKINLAVVGKMNWINEREDRW